MDKWIKDVAYNVLSLVSEKKWGEFNKYNVTTASSINDMETAIDMYPEKISSPPISAKEKFSGIRLFDNSGWAVRGAFFDSHGNETDLELRLFIYGSSSNYKVDINGILVP